MAGRTDDVDDTGALEPRRLRSEVLEGGAYLAARQAIGLVIGLTGVVLLTRGIGPTEYGLYAGALGILGYVQNVSLWGINVYLVRHEEDDQRAVFDQAATLLILLGVAATVIVITGAAWVNRWVQMPRLVPVLRALIAALPVALLSQVVLARLERRLDYRRVALVELLGQSALYLVALPLAYRGMGVWAAVAGWWTQQALVFATLMIVARYVPRFHWDLRAIRKMLGYGLGFSASIWIWQLRSLVNPLVVGRYLGADAVGQVALAIRCVEYLSFVKSATWRISLAALSRVRGDVDRLRRAVSEGMRLQVMALGPLLVGFAWIAPSVFPALFGDAWLPALQVYPYIAISYLVNALFNLHASALYVLRRNWTVSAFHLVHIALFAMSAIAIVPRIGLFGYGVSELAAISSYVVLHRLTARTIGRPAYTVALVWCAAFSAALLHSGSTLWLLASMAGIAAWPRTWRELGYVWTSFMRSRRAA